MILPALPKRMGCCFAPIRDKMDPDHIEIAILQDDASKANRIIEKLQLVCVDTGTAELVDLCSRSVVKPLRKPSAFRPRTVGDFEVGDEEQFNMVFPLGSENASPSEPFSDSSRFLQTRRRRAPISFEPRVSAPACAWNCRILPPTCETGQRHPKTVCPSCR